MTAATAVRRAILDGSLAPGSRINEVHLAAELGFSRSPLREALRALEEEGLIVKQPYRGAYVATVGPEVIEEIASLRARLEPFAIELALPRLRADAGRARLDRALADLAAAVARRDTADAIDVHMGIHRLFYELADHKLLLDCWRSWESQLRIYLALDASTFTSLDTLMDDHARLAAVLVDGQDGDIAEMVTEHVLGAADHAAKIVHQLNP
ncbi:MAG TPA: GntR family transcriptional regulator [Pseudonocardia sp.]